MKKEEKKLLIELAKSMIGLYTVGGLGIKNLETVMKTFEDFNVDDEDEDDWGQIMDRNFKSFLKHVQDAHKGAKVERSDGELTPPTCDLTKCKEGQKNEVGETLYTVFLKGGERVDIYGNSSLRDQSGLTIYADARHQTLKAVFNEFEGYTINPAEDEEC